MPQRVLLGRHQPVLVPVCATSQNALKRAFWHCKWGCEKGEQAVFWHLKKKSFAKEFRALRQTNNSDMTAPMVAHESLKGVGGGMACTVFDVLNAKHRLWSQHEVLVKMRGRWQALVCACPLGQTLPSIIQRRAMDVHASSPLAHTLPPGLCLSGGAGGQRVRSLGFENGLKTVPCHRIAFPPPQTLWGGGGWRRGGGKTTPATASTTPSASTTGPQ